MTILGIDKGTTGFGYFKIGFVNPFVIYLFLISLPVLKISIWSGKIINRNIKTIVFCKEIIIILISGPLLFYTSLDKMKTAGITLKSIGTIFRISK